MMNDNDNELIFPICKSCIYKKQFTNIYMNNTDNGIILFTNIYMYMNSMDNGFILTMGEMYSYF